MKMSDPGFSVRLPKPTPAQPVPGLTRPTQRVVESFYQ